MAGTTPRKRIKNDHPYPETWTVSFEWEFVKGKNIIRIESRTHDVRVDKTWYMFERHVDNGNGSEWLDTFEMHPYGGFKAIRPEEVAAVRVHQEPKKAKNDDNGRKIAAA